MADFNIVAQLQLRAPQNISNVVGQMQQQLSGVKFKIAADSKPLAQANKALKQTVVATKQATTNFKQLGSTVAKVGKTTTTSMDGAANSMEKFGANTALALKRYSAFLLGAGQLTAFVFAIRNGLTEALKFEAELIRIAQVSGATVAAMRPLSNTITDISISLGISSTELIGVARSLKQTGLSAKDTAIALEAIAKADLSPTFESMAKTTEGVIAIMRQFNVPASEIEAKLSSINALSAQFAVESGDLIQVIRRAGGAFRVAGGSLEELLALFTAVRSTTRENAESIATGLRTIFTRITKGTTIRELELLGISLKNTEGQFVGPLQAFEKLGKAIQQLKAEGGGAADLRFFDIAQTLVEGATGDFADGAIRGKFSRLSTDSAGNNDAVLEDIIIVKLGVN